MYKIIGLSALLFGAATSMHAQDKGFVSGTIAFSSEKVDRDGSSSDRTTDLLRFGPAVGFNLSPHDVVGLALDFSTGKVTDDDLFYDVNGNLIGGLIMKENLFEIAPFYRYVKSVGDKFSLYGQVKIGVGFGKRTAEADGLSDREETRLSTLRAGIGPGIVFVPATHWALTADWGLIGYSSRTEDPENDNARGTTTGRFEAGLNPAAITLALNWLF